MNEKQRMAAVLLVSLRSEENGCNVCLKLNLPTQVEIIAVFFRGHSAAKKNVSFYMCNIKYSEIIKGIGANI